MLAEKLAGELAGMFPEAANSLQRVYMGRVGFGETPVSRSVRRPLESLLVDAAPS